MFFKLYKNICESNPSTGLTAKQIIMHLEQNIQKTPIDENGFIFYEQIVLLLLFASLVLYTFTYIHTYIHT